MVLLAHLYFNLSAAELPLGLSKPAPSFVTQLSGTISSQLRKVNVCSSSRNVGVCRGWNPHLTLRLTRVI